MKKIDHKSVVFAFSLIVAASTTFAVDSLGAQDKRIQWGQGIKLKTSDGRWLMNSRFHATTSPRGVICFIPPVWIIERAGKDNGDRWVDQGESFSLRLRNSSGSLRLAGGLGHGNTQTGVREKRDPKADHFRWVFSTRTERQTRGPVVRGSTFVVRLDQANIQPRWLTAVKLLRLRFGLEGSSNFWDTGTRNVLFEKGNKYDIYHWTIN